MTVVWLVVVLWLMGAVPFAVVFGMCIGAGLSQPEPEVGPAYADKAA